MNWVRSKVRQAALLALFALAVQLVLSFGHFHNEGLLRGALQVSQHEASAPLSPLQHSDGLAADDCAICASIAQLDALVASVPPAPPVPPSFATAVETVTSDFVLPDLTRSAFQSRGPPLS